jgi:hypothetical protein
VRFRTQPFCFDCQVLQPTRLKHCLLNPRKRIEPASSRLASHGEKSVSASSGLSSVAKNRAADPVKLNKKEDRVCQTGPRGWFVLKGGQSLTGRGRNANPVNLVSRLRRSAGMEAIREPKTSVSGGWEIGSIGC